MNTEVLIENNNIRIDPSNDTNTKSICYNIYFDNIFAGSIGISTTNPNHLDDIFIEKKYRRNGIGKYLLDYFNIDELCCTTWNHVGILFYKSIGFIEKKRDIYLITFHRELDDV